MAQLDRREFIALAGSLCAGALAGSGTARAQPEGETMRTIYRGRHLMQVAMPMGGLGAGNVALSGRGSLIHWQIFNQCNPDAQLQAAFFAIWARAEGAEPVAKLLQIDPVGRLPMVDGVEFVGEYPFARITYYDQSLPVQVQLESYCPLIPLNAQDSGLPGVVFRFTVRNPGEASVSVSLAQTCQNAVGYDGFGSFEEAYGNLNRVVRRGGLNTLFLTTQENVTGAGFRTPVVIATESRQAARIARFFGNTDLRFFDSLTNAPDVLTPTATATPGLPLTTSALASAPTPNAKGGERPHPQPLPQEQGRGETDVKAARPPSQARHEHVGALLAAPLAGQPEQAPVVAIVEDIDPLKSFPLLAKFVQEGGSLVVLGGRGLLEAAQPEAFDASAILYEDFEAAKYDPAKWTVMGSAFGDGPARGTWPGQNPVSGFQGGGLVNSFRGGDAAMGKLTSKPFPITRHYLHFLIGGGNHPGETCINLYVGGKIVRTATGPDSERLRPERWDVREFVGQEGYLEIVDMNQGAWGHINIDEILFSDRAIPAAAMTPEQHQQVRDFLPFTFTRVEDGPQGGPPQFSDFTLSLGTPDVTLRRDANGLPTGAIWRYGKGRIALTLLSLDDLVGNSPTAANDRRTALGSLIAQASGLDFIPADGLAATHPQFGSMALATDATDVTSKAQWDSLDAFWQDFATDGRLDPAPSAPALPGKTWNGALAAQVTLAPGEEKEITFLLGWHFPNRYRDRVYDVGFGNIIPEYEVKYRLGNQYNNWFRDAGEVVAYLHKHDARLLRETRLFHATFYDSTLPYVLRDAISSQISTLRSQSSMWLENGHWFAYEGLGCCPMNCTHVYNYAQTLAHLFPELERDVRRTDFTVQLKPDGGVRHRVQLPLDAPRVTDPFTDGHLSTISKAYREHRQSADDAFLIEFWPAIKQAVEFAIRTYDADGDGMVEGRQPNTYDCDVYGHNSFITTQYLAALRAAEEMARERGEAETAARYHALFAQGSRNLDAACWNGEYYRQIFADYLTTPTQYGPGCLSDQLLGQWWAHVNDLGYLLPKERVQAALQAVLKHNFITDFTHWDYHGQRVFADGKDQGLVCCTWPQGSRPTDVPPILYCDEVWTGVEYQVAGHLLYEDMTDESLKMVTALRARYDGYKRNPWNEIECSDHYGRAMASWALLLAASGCRYHGPKGILCFAPRLTPEDFRSFFTTAQGWGQFAQKRTPTAQENTLALVYGTLHLNELHLGLPAAVPQATLTAEARVGGKRLPITVSIVPETGEVRLVFPTPLLLKAGQTLQIQLNWTAGTTKV